MRFLLGPLGWIPQSSKKYFVCAWLPMFSCQKGGQKSKPFATLMLTSSQCFTKSIFLKFFYMLNITAVKISADILLKILQDRLEQYVNREPPDIQAGFRKGRGTRDQMSNICWIIKKSKRVPKKHLLLLYWQCQSLWLCGSPQTVENSSRDGSIRPRDLPPEKSGCRSGSNSWNWTWNNRLVPNRERNTSRPYIVTCLFNLYAEYIMRNAGLDELQAGIKIARRNINNLRYANDTTLVAESEDELKSQPLDESERGKWKSWPKDQHSENNIMASGPITLWQIDGETVETVTDFILGGLQNHHRWWLKPWY